MGVEYMQQQSGQTSSMHKGINVYQPCAKFQKRTKETAAVLQHMRNVYENLQRETKVGKGKLETPRRKSLYDCRFPAELPFCFELYQGGDKVFKHRYLLAGKLVPNTTDIVLTPRNTPPSLKNVCTCADA